MAKTQKQQSAERPATTGIDPAKRQKLAARAEQRLLVAEQDAEQRLVAAWAKLAKAEARLAKRQASVAKAENRLRKQQAERSAGPVSV